MYNHAKPKVEYIGDEEISSILYYSRYKVLKFDTCSGDDMPFQMAFVEGGRDGSDFPF